MTFHPDFTMFAFRTFYKHCGYKRTELRKTVREIDMGINDQHEKYILYFNCLPKNPSDQLIDKYALFNAQLYYDDVKKILSWDNLRVSEQIERYLLNLNIPKLIIYENILRTGNVDDLATYIEKKYPLFEIGYNYALCANKNQLKMLQMLYENKCPITLCSSLYVLTTKNKEIIEYMFGISINDATIADIYAMGCQDLGLNIDKLPSSPYALLYGYDGKSFDVDKKTFLEIINLMTYNEKTFPLLQISNTEDDIHVTLDEVNTATRRIKWELYINGRLDCSLWQLMCSFV